MTTGGEFPGLNASQQERSAMIKRSAGRWVARNGLEEKPRVVVSPGDFCVPEERLSWVLSEP